MSDHQKKLVENFKEAWAFRIQGEHEKAIEIVESSLVVSEMEKLKEAQAKFLTLKGRILRDQGKLIDAYQFYEKAEVIYAKLFLEESHVNVLRQMADISQMIGDFEKSEAIFNQIFELNNRFRFADLEKANAFRVYAILKESTDDKSNAVLYWKKARELYQACDILEGVKECDSHLESLSQEL